MRKCFVIIPLFALFAGCQTDKEKMDKLRVELIGVDKQWSELSQKKGYYHTRIDFSEDSAIEFEEGKMPVMGRKAFEADIASHPDSNFCLGWTPLKAEISSSGDLGYTFGGFAYMTKTKFGKDTTFYGNYVTIWRKQPDGKWKFLVDGGTDTPAPVKDLK
jgi:ketosteroid isomerase-like protein